MQAEVLQGVGVLLGMSTLSVRAHMMVMAKEFQDHRLDPRSPSAPQSSNYEALSESISDCIFG
jgi:hypothetical protein